MRPSKQPRTSRGRDKHVVAVLVPPDALAFEVAVLQQLFGRRIPILTAVTGDAPNPYELVLCGERPRQQLPAGTDLGQLAPLDTLLTADTVMIPGVEEPLAERDPALLARLRAAGDHGTRMVSFCAGAFLLGSAGVLDRRRATTHWLLAREFRAAFPLTQLEPARLYVDDGPVHTSGGMFSVVDLSLHLMALDLGQAYASDVGRLLVSPPHRQGGQAQFMKESLRIDDQAGLSPLLDWVRDHLHERLTLARLAEYQHVSERSLIRKFRADTGMSVFDWITRERISRAQMLLETTDLPVSDVAFHVGFGSMESLRRNFEKLVGTTASGYRAAFRAS